MWCLIAGDTTTLTFKKTIRHNAAVVVFWTCLFRSWPHGDNTGSFCLCECKPCVILTAPLMERGPQQGAGRWLVATGHGSHINEGESHGGRAGMHGAPLTLHLIIYTHDESKSVDRMSAQDEKVLWSQKHHGCRTKWPNLWYNSFWTTVAIFSCKT